VEKCETRQEELKSDEAERVGASGSEEENGSESENENEREGKRF